MFSEEEEQLIQAVLDKNEDSVRELSKHMILEGKEISSFLHYSLTRELDHGDIQGSMHRIIQMLVRDFKFNINSSTPLNKPVLFFYNNICRKPINSLIGMNANIF